MGIFGKIFGTDKAVENIIDKDNGLLTQVGSWVGGMNYTDEERAEAGERTRLWGLKQLEALAPFKVVQRILAFAAALLWVFVALNVVGAIWYDAAVGCTGVGEAAKCSNVAGVMLKFALSDYVFWPVVSVFALYFTGGVIESRNRSAP